jgi:hypothetical protein
VTRPSRLVANTSAAVIAMIAATRPTRVPNNERRSSAVAPQRVAHARDRPTGARPSEEYAAQDGWNCARLRAAPVAAPWCRPSRSARGGPATSASPEEEHRSVEVQARSRLGVAGRPMGKTGDRA